MSNPKIDILIENSAPFAIPILNHFRQLMHQAIPEIEETIKWSMMTFELNGKIVCSLASYKKHCALRFFNGHLMEDPNELLQPVGKTNMRHIGNVSSLEGFPSNEVLLAYIKNAAEVA